MDLDKMTAKLNSGCIYTIGRCKNGFQPILVLNVAKFAQSDASLEDKLAETCFISDWVINNMMVPGHIESWLVIMDFKDVGVT